MTDIRFRKARRDEIEAIVDLIAADSLGELREDISRPLNARYLAAFEAIDNDVNQLLAVADDGGEIVGCLQITFIPGLSRTGAWRGHIEAVRIAASQRGAGLGRRFIEWAIKQCHERGCTLAQLTSDKQRADAHRFYKSLGFVDSHEGMKLKL